MDKLANYLQAIAEAYPNLPIQSAYLHDKDGQYNDVLIVNDDIIFRFPRYSEGVATIRREVQILTRIQDYTTLAIPNPIYTSLGEQRPGKVFMGYWLISGKPLWRETFQSIRDDETLQRLATQLVGFLKELHGISVAEMGIDLPIHDGPEEWAELYAEFRQHLYPFMRPDARDWVTNHFETYLNAPHLHVYQPALRHGDFGTGNILYDPKNRSISGIIDFGSAGVGDPALDIAASLTFGESFFTRFYSTYPEIESMLERAHFYRGTYALQEALHGIKNGDKEAFESGIAPYV
ncbi:MAG TPA: phosphotransferase [Anaerolineae bacterium]